MSSSGPRRDADWAGSLRSQANLPRCPLIRNPAALPATRPLKPTPPSLPPPIRRRVRGDESRGAAHSRDDGKRRHLLQHDRQVCALPPQTRPQSSICQWYRSRLPRLSPLSGLDTKPRDSTFVPCTPAPTVHNDSDGEPPGPPRGEERPSCPRQTVVAVSPPCYARSLPRHCGKKPPDAQVPQCRGRQALIRSRLAAERERGSRGPLRSAGPHVGWASTPSRTRNGAACSVSTPDQGAHPVGTLHIRRRGHKMGELDPSSLHRGCAPARGEKWVASLWFRNGPVQ